jgi:signal transduction histidine kinase
MMPCRCHRLDNGRVSQASAAVDRVTVVYRRVTGASGWPLAAGALCGMLATIEVALRGRASGSPSTTLLLSLAATVPLAFARTSVLTAAVTITAATLLTLALDQRLTGAGVVAQVAVVYLLGRRRSWWVTGAVLLPLVVGVTSYAGVASSGSGVNGSVVPAALLSLTVIAAGLGVVSRARGQTAALTATRQAMADTLLEHAARGERARIARELHDVVAHHISMISVQAEIARLTTPGMPTEGATRLAAIGDTARTALTEMQRLLDVLRSDAGTEPTRKPQPGLDQLNELIDEARDAGGASTRLIVRGRVVPLDAGLQLSAYRIIQEALTNARRHAPGAAVDVELLYTGDALHLRVRDNGPGPPDGVTAAGHGLLGMRERAAMVGGTLSTGRARTGGFLVEATLPMPEPAP